MAPPDVPVSSRRRLVAAFGCALFAPLGLAQPRGPARVYRLGVLIISNDQATGFVEALRGELKQLGFVDGVNLSIEYRVAGREPGKLAEAAASLVAGKPDVIITAGGSVAALAVQAASKTIPIVFTLVGDPVDRGLVASLARPAGNATGNAMSFADLEFKRVQLISEMVGKGSRIAVLLGAIPPNAAATFGERMKHALPEIADRLTLYNAARVDDLESVFDTMTRDQNAALSISVAPAFSVRIARLTELATRSRLPAIGFDPEFVSSGLLMSYSPDKAEILKRSVTYVQRIFNGAAPSDLPVEMVSRFELVVSNKSAKALGIKIPASILARADSFID